MIHSRDSHVHKTDKKGHQQEIATSVQTAPKPWFLSSTSGSRPAVFPAAPPPLASWPLLHPASTSNHNDRRTLTSHHNDRRIPHTITTTTIPRSTSARNHHHHHGPDHDINNPFASSSHNLCRLGRSGRPPKERLGNRAPEPESSCWTCVRVRACRLPLEDDSKCVQSGVSGFGLQEVRFKRSSNTLEHIRSESGDGRTEEERDTHLRVEMVQGRELLPQLPGHRAPKCTVTSCRWPGKVPSERTGNPKTHRQITHSRRVEGVL